ncbi:HAD family hydrolase [Palleronia caenipelagi]|uniref:HAD family hydrolase n=1 Tax=Palleronia caenipelagi TaxID=2489174 RepID=A0A547Q5I4_9RHOB|nr:HAD family hydrolase [Palleronia caenipelagi]TRD21650.1 HAD family hydrolase [Palleronia caenipelagi]
MATITTVGFDADDTLWHNERFFKMTEARFAELLADHAEQDHLAERLLEAERRNVGHYGFGIKGFMLSMIETALDVTGDRVPAEVVRGILDAGQEMLAHPIELLPHARDAIEALHGDYCLLLVTKGDLLDQERKLAQSGLGDLFDGIEIVSGKHPETYTRIFSDHGDGPDSGLMAGNSLASDVLPMIAAGGYGVYVPHGQIWALEEARPPTGEPRYHEIEDLGQLPGLVRDLK